MKTVILAGGFGTRISEESTIRPKPMVEIGGMPVIWHIMKLYSAHGIDEFIVCCGYKGHTIKEWFANYALHTSDMTFDLRRDEMTVHHRRAEDWRVTLVDTGLDTMTGGRIRRVEEYVGDETFCLTYGDGLADIDITALVAFHREQQTLATLTAVQPPGRFGALALDDDRHVVGGFREKPSGDGHASWINGGFFVCEPKVVEYIESDATVWEREPMERLAHEDNLAAFRHTGFWQPMDTLRDKHVLEDLWSSGAVVAREHGADADAPRCACSGRCVPPLRGRRRGSRSGRDRPVGGDPDP